MQLTVNDRPVAKLAAKDERAIPLGWRRATVVGSVLGPDEAQAAAARSFAIVGGGGAALVWLFLFGLWRVAAPADRAFYGALALAVGAAFPFAMFGVYRFRLARWRRQAPRRMAAAPPPGAPVRLDAAGLTVGDAFVAWGDLVVERVDLTSIAGRQSAGYFLRRLAVRGPNLACALDVGLMRNGQAIVNEVYRRLCRPALRRR